jgi:hypothetical protein
MWISPLHAEANEEKIPERKKKKQKKRPVHTSSAREKNHGAWWYLVAKAVDGHGGSVEELMERDPGGGGINVAALHLGVAAIVGARRVVEVEPQPAGPDAAVVVAVVDDRRRSSSSPAAPA